MDKPLKNIDDAYKWSTETAEALRAGDLSRIDMDELINEIESIASGLRRELVSVLRDIIGSLLVLEFTGPSDKERRQSELQLTRAQGQLQLALDSAPSLRGLLDDSIALAYRDAREWVEDEFSQSLPDRCPFPAERITEHPYDRMLAEGRFA